MAQLTDIQILFKDVFMCFFEATAIFVAELNYLYYVLMNSYNIFYPAEILPQLVLATSLITT